MTALRGPSDADHYRVKVGRYNDRWYTDPLPTCPIADATDWQGPSWSIVKGAAGKDWSFVTNKRNGHTATAELHRIADLEPDERTQAFNAINKNGLTQAGGRGTIVHLWAEDLLAGRGPRIITDPILFSLKLPKAALEEATEYVEALSAFFDHYQPEVIAAEYVALHRTLNGVGYGCTPDVVAVVQGQVVGIDWKTRGADSDHGAYPEEAAQIAAGACAEYMIITGSDGTPIRAPLPKIDCGIVVSIKPDGCRIYPTDIDLGFQHVEAMHSFWVARRSEKAAIGKPWPPTPTVKQENLWTTASTTPSKPSKSSKQPSDPSMTQPTATTSGATTRGTKTGSPATASHPTTTDTTASSTTPASPSTDPTDDVEDGEGDYVQTMFEQQDEAAFAYTSLTIANAMTSWPDELRQHLKDWWPGGCPTPGQIRAGEAVWTEQQIDAITALCDLGDTPFWETTAPVIRHSA